MTLLGTIAGIVGSIMGLANVPQAVKIFRTKCAKDISGITYGMLLIGAFVWVLYGIESNDMPILITNSVGVVAVGFVMLGWFMYGRKKKCC